MFLKQLFMSIFVVLFASNAMAVVNDNLENKILASGSIEFVGSVVEAPCNSLIQYDNNKVSLQNECFLDDASQIKVLSQADLQLIVDDNQRILLPLNKGYIAKERQYSEKGYVLSVIHY